MESGQQGMTDNHNDGSKVKKTRYRVPTVCSVCRRRKMKCDKAKPHCSSCVKNKTKHLCVYEEQPWANNNEIQKLKEQIYALQNQNSELKSLVNNKLLASKTSYVKGNNLNLIIPDEPDSDPILELTRDFNVLALKESKMAHFGSTSFMALITNDPILREMFKKYLQAQNWGINFDKFYLYDHGIETGPKMPAACPTFFDQEMSESQNQLIGKINQILPSRELVMDLIDHFFAETYAFVPFIDEKSFRQNMQSLVSITSEGKAQLDVPTPSLFCSVALLLTVLRLSFLTLPSNFEESSSLCPKVQKIINSGVTIDPSYIEYTKDCLSNSGALRKPTLKHIQAYLILRIYRIYAPEDGDDSTDSTIFLAMIVQMAKTHGLHRDPSSFSLVTDPGTANLWRKIWLQLMHMDAIQAYTFGCPLLIDEEYDTMLPVPNVNDSAMERSSIEWLRKIHEVTLLYRSVLKCTSKIKDPPKRSDIENALTQVEFAIQRYPNIDELTSVSPNEGALRKITKLRDLLLKMQLYTLHTCTHYLLSLACNIDEVSLTKKYRNKTAESLFIAFRFYTKYANDIKYYNQGLNYEAFVSSFVFGYGKRILQIIVSYALRGLVGMIDISRCLENYIFPGDSIGTKEWLEPISHGITVSDQCVINLIRFEESLSKLQNRYYSCFKGCIIMKMFFDNIDSQMSGKYESMKRKLHEYRQANGLPEEPSSYTNTISTPGDSPMAVIAGVWESLVDASGQSKFDYLNGDHDKFKNVGDPYFNSPAYLGPYVYRDYNNILEPPPPDEPAFSFDPSLDLSIPSPSNMYLTDFNNFFSGDMQPQSITTDGISPHSSENSQTRSQTNKDTSSSMMGQSFTQVNLSENMFNPEVNEKTNEAMAAFEEQEIALQVAKSMFGGSKNGLDNDYI